MITDYINMDTQNISYVNESSNTSGYSTMSPGQGSVRSTPPSPSQSPSAILQTEFSNLNLPPSTAGPPQALHAQPIYATLQNATLLYGAHPQSQSTLLSQSQLHTATPHAYMNYTAPGGGGGTGMSSAMVSLPQHQYGVDGIGLGGGGMQQMVQAAMRVSPVPTNQLKHEYPAELRILEHPVEKFRFRYKSEMHGTHGSLNGANSKRTPKTFPEVELRNFSGHAVIRCSLFQTNLESPHSHQLVVRKDDTDICDPHDLHVSPERGYIAQFQNMGIIHTAKKFIMDELLKKKMNRLRFELGRDELSTKEVQELHKETEKEAKEMNLNQVRLCFEAFKVDPDDRTYTRIAAPVYTNPINNRKSAQTGELRICRLSIATGSVSGGDDLILLVEKVSKKNIKVRFFEFNEDDGLIWEAFGKFRESDVHHQYAIVCQTPQYKDKDIDRPVDVCIELVRPSDDERSYPPVTFRYKPRDVVVSRKRRRTTSSATSSSGSGSSISSFELPKPVQEQAAHMKMDTQQQMQNAGYGMNPTISEEFDKSGQISKLIGSEMFKEFMQYNSEELAKMCPIDNMPDICDALQLKDCGQLEQDGTSSNVSKQVRHLQFIKSIFTPVVVHRNSHLQRIFQIHDETRTAKNLNKQMILNAAKQIEDIFHEYAEKNEHRETILDEVVACDDSKLLFKVCHILRYFNLTHLFNKPLNVQNESALHTACLHNRVAYVRPLLGLGCDPNLQNRQGNTALHIAVQDQHQKCIESFLNKNGQRIDLTIKNDEGFTPLHLAIRQNNTEAARKLLEYNRTAARVPNTKDGNNALHMAVLQQNIELVKLVLEGQNVTELLSMPNASGRNAYDLTKEIDAKSGKEIEVYLTLLVPFVCQGSLAIKEEEMSSSSAEEDDDNDASMTSDPTTALENIKIKEEYTGSDDNNAHDEAGFKALKGGAKMSNHNLAELLRHEVKFQNLAHILNAGDKWKRLAEALRMDHLLCLWNSAADMLDYVRKHIEYNDFIKALANIDEAALHILQQ